MKILGIETSCDETAAAVVEDGAVVLSSVIASQEDLHARYGGVVPEAASRRHVERMLPVIHEALAGAGVKLSDIDGIAVTNRPGLLGALLVGVSAAKAIAFARSLPICPVHHLEGHIYSALLTRAAETIAFPLLVLIVSGGHTQLVRMDGHGQYAILGATRDDAAGEAFDKCARMMGLPFPGGPSLARLAEAGRHDAVAFPRAMAGDNLEFSFSGLKTALRNYIARDEGHTAPEDVAASLQEAIVDVLVSKTRRAMRREGIRTAAIVGGVSANRRLQAVFAGAAEADGFDVIFPPAGLSTDNAAMIAAAGYRRLIARPMDLSFDTLANEPLAPDPYPLDEETG